MEINATVENAGTAAAEEQAWNQSIGEDTAGASSEKKYTDSDVNRIVSNRLAREREKTSKLQQQESDFEQRERELTRRELKADARDELAATGLPMSVAEVLNYNSREEYEESMKAMRKIVSDLRDAWERARATGRTPKAYTTNNSEADLRKAFRS